MGQNQIDHAKVVSVRFERAWHIYSHPHKYTQEEVSWAVNYLREQTESFVTYAQLNPEVEVMMDMVYLGLFHNGWPGYSSSSRTQSNN